MDADEHYIPRSGPMYCDTSSARSEMATNLAIPLLARDGWSALTLRNMATAGNVTPQAIAAWFPSVVAMRVAVAERYARRWVGHLGLQAHRRALRSGKDVEALTVPDVVTFVLPHTWLEETFDGVWLTIVEAGRWDTRIAVSVAWAQEQERDVIRGLIDPRGRRDRDQLEHEVEQALALVRGLRVTRAQPRRTG